MIHFTKEGEHLKLGLNVRRAAGGFVLIWAWYDMPTNTVTGYRFRFRRHIKPRILFDKDSWNVVDNEMMLADTVIVRKEYLRDLLASQRDMVNHTNRQSLLKTEAPQCELLDTQ